MQVAEVLVRIMEDEGITDIFGIPGAGINPVYKYLGESEKIDHFTMRHEEAAVHAADGYYRSSGKISAAICTSGPGATNFVTGVYTAYIDSIPLIAITGQNVTALLGKDAFQCVDIASICAPVAKKTWCVTDPAEAPKIFREAFKVAREGRPGPVVIDLPLDVQKTEVEYDAAADKSLEIPVPGPAGDKISAALDLLEKAEKPVMIMGGGTVLSGGTAECLALAEFLNIPLITTYMAKGGVPADHPLHVGHAGIQVGGPLGNKIFLESDVVLGIGCRFTDRHTGNLEVYKGDRKFIHVDIEPTQIGRIIEPAVGIVSDAKLACEALLSEAKQRGEAWKGAPRVAELPELKKKLNRKTFFDNKLVKPQRVYHELNQVFEDDTLFTTGCGLNQIWSGQFQQINKPQMYLPSGGAGTLGFDIPAAFGASIGAGKKKVVAVMGDFGFTFLVEELAVAAAYDIPVVVVILNNGSLSLIRQNQKYAYGYEYAVGMKENLDKIDYIKVSEGFGCTAERVTTPDEIAPALKRAMESAQPYVVEVLVEEDADASMGMALDAIKEFE